MAWTEITRRQYRRDDLADLRDQEWALLAENGGVKVDHGSGGIVLLRAA